MIYSLFYQRVLIIKAEYDDYYLKHVILNKRTQTALSCNPCPGKSPAELSWNLFFEGIRGAFLKVISNLLSSGDRQKLQARFRFIKTT